jgi:type IV secretion system protein VirB10
MKDNNDHKDDQRVQLDKNPMEDSSTPHALDNSEDSLYHNELEESDDKAEIEYGKTAVARGAKQNMVMFVGLIFVILIVIYFVFFKDSSPKTAPADSDPSEATKPVSAADELALPSIPDSLSPPVDFSLPDSQKIQPNSQSKSVPTPPPPPPSISKPMFNPPPIASAPPAPAPIHAQDPQQSFQAKIQAPMIMGGGKDGGEKKKDAAIYVEDFVPDHTSSSQQKITQVGNMSLLIAQGKVIETVLETPLNTNYPGPVRAIVSSDVYSENGNNVLIPRGSRVIGQFSGGYSPGQTRVILTWDRIIMPNGYDVAVSSPAVGPVGTMGIEGIVDNQLAQTVANALLVSALNVSFAQVTSNATGSGGQTSSSVTTGPSGTTTNSTSSPTQQAIQQQASDLSNTMQSAVQGAFSPKPFISVDQGTLVSIFVNRDLLFPASISNNGVMVK